MHLPRFTALALSLLCFIGASESSFATAAKKGLRNPVRILNTLPVVDDSFENRVQSFIRDSATVESGHAAQVFERGFAPIANGVPGAPRRVITVSRAAFPILARLFSTQDVLFVYHAPNSRNIITAFNGFQGEQGRLLDPFNFNYAGTLLIPIVLKPAEGARAHDFFQLAGNVKRKSDIALFPWLLKNEAGTPYVTPGNMDLLSEWFMRMPIGEALNENERREPYVTTGLTPLVADVVQRVWTAPYSHQTLAQALGLHPADEVRLFKTPGMIANALLGSASLERVPVVFRFVEDYATPLETDFNTWIDSDFDPGNSG